MARVRSQRLAAGWTTSNGVMVRSRRHVRGSSRGARTNESTHQAAAFCQLGQRIDGKVVADNTMARPEELQQSIVGCPAALDVWSDHAERGAALFGAQRKTMATVPVGVRAGVMKMHFVHDGRRSDALVPDGYAAGHRFPVSLLAPSPSPGEPAPPGRSHEAVCKELGDTSAVQVRLGLALRLRGGGDDKEDDEGGSSQQFGNDVEEEAKEPYADTAATQAFGDDDDSGETAEPAHR